MTEMAGYGLSVYHCRDYLSAAKYAGGGFSEVSFFGIFANDCYFLYYTVPVDSQIQNYPAFYAGTKGNGWIGNFS